MKKLVENFRDFITATGVHQDPGATKRYEYGLNPTEDLPFNFERRPEIGEDNQDDILYKLEQMEALIQASKEKYSKLKEASPEHSSYIKNSLRKAYGSLREAYLRLMDS